MKNLFKINRAFWAKKKLFLFLTVLCFSANIFADGGIFEAYVTYGTNEAAVTPKKVGDIDNQAPEVNLGTINKFQLDSFFVKVWQKDGDHFDKVSVNYKIDGGDLQAIDGAWKRDLSESDREWGIKVDKDIVADLADGDHTLEVWFVGELTTPTTLRYLNNKDASNYKFKFKKGTETPQDITYKVKVPAGITKCFIAGDWDNTGNWVWKEMGTVDALDHQFEYLAHNQLPSFQYKYCSAADWDHKELKADDSDIEPRTFGDSIDIVVKFKEPQPIEFKSKAFGYASGMKFTTTANPDSLVLEVNYTAAQVDSFIIVSDKIYKIAGDAETMHRGNCTDWGLKEDEPGTKDVAIDIDEVGKYIYIWKPSIKKVSVIYPAQVKQDITYKVKVPAGTTKCFIAGDWNGDGNWVWKEMGTVDAVDHQFEYLAHDQVKSFKYKYCSAADWDHKELKADDSEMPERTYGDTIDVVAKFKAPDARPKRAIVLVPGELKSDDPSMIIFAFTAGKEAYSVNMEVQKQGDDTVAYKAEIPKELDSLIFVRAKHGVDWNSLIWEGDGKNVWNQSEDQKLTAECDTARFISWGEGDGAKFKVSWCSVAPQPGEKVWYIKLPYAEGDWNWHLMTEEADGTWSHAEKWFGGGANLNTSMVDDSTLPDFKYIADSEMDFGENQVAPEKGTDCTFIWNPTTLKLAVNYVKPQGIENVTIELNLNEPIYNILGVEVDASFHGIVIQNGHKFIR